MLSSTVYKYSLHDFFTKNIKAHPKCSTLVAVMEFEQNYNQFLLILVKHTKNVVKMLLKLKKNVIKMQN